jgi:hypothetical protein
MGRSCGAKRNRRDKLRCKIKPLVPPRGPYCEALAATRFANATSSDRAHALASKLRDAAALSMADFSSSVQRKRKYVDFARSGSFFGLAMFGV